MAQQKKAVAEEAVETVKTEETVAEEAVEKTVKIRIPKTKKEQEDVFVSVNNKTWLIKRGTEVEVPECVAEVLRHQEEMLEVIMNFDAPNK